MTDCVMRLELVQWEANPEARRSPDVGAHLRTCDRCAAALAELVSAREDLRCPRAVHGGWGRCYFSCSRAVVRKMVPTRWVNSAWVVTSVVNQSRWLPPASFFSASTTDSSAAW